MREALGLAASCAVPLWSGWLVGRSRRALIRFRPAASADPLRNASTRRRSAQGWNKGVYLYWSTLRAKEKSSAKVSRLRPSAMVNPRSVRENSFCNW